MGSNKPFLLQKISDWTRDITSLANPVLLLFVTFIFLGPSPIFYKLILALVVNEAFCTLIKIFFHKKRPTEQTFETLLQKVDAGSFPSIHTSRITLAYLTLFLNTENQLIKIVMITAILLVMLSRILLKKHYWIDVIGGFIIGVIVWLIFFNQDIF